MKTHKSFRGCNTNKTRLDQFLFFHLTFYIVINVTWFKRPIYDKRITLIWKLFLEILEVISEGTSQDKTQPPERKWSSSTFGSHCGSSFNKKKFTYIWRQGHSKCWDCRIRNQADELSSWTEKSKCHIPLLETKCNWERWAKLNLKCSFPQKLRKKSTCWRYFSIMQLQFSGIQCLSIGYDTYCTLQNFLIFNCEQTQSNIENIHVICVVTD